MRTAATAWHAPLGTSHTQHTQHSYTPSHGEMLFAFFKSKTKKNNYCIAHSAEQNSNIFSFKYLCCGGQQHDLSTSDQFLQIQTELKQKQQACTQQLHVYIDIRKNTNFILLLLVTNQWPLCALGCSCCADTHACASTQNQHELFVGLVGVFFSACISSSFFIQRKQKTDLATIITHNRRRHEPNQNLLWRASAHDAHIGHSQSIGATHICGLRMNKFWRPGSFVRSH